MIGHYISMALGGFGRHKGYTLTKVAALALGLTCFLGAHMVSDYYKSFDTQFANANRIVVVRQQVIWPGTDRAFPMMVTSAAPLARYLKAVGGQVVHAARLKPANVLRYE